MPKSKKKPKGAVAIKQAQVLKNIGKYGSITKAAEAAGYSPSYARKGLMQKTKAWEELIEEYLPDEELARVHLEGLKATRIQSNPLEGDNVVPDYGVRHKYLDTAYKIKKKHDNTININAAITKVSDEELEEELATIVSEAFGDIAGEEKKTGK